MLYDKIIIFFIIKLLISKNLITKGKYNTILLIIARHTKYLNISSFKKKYIVDKVESFMLDRQI